MGRQQRGALGAAEHGRAMCSSPVTRRRTSWRSMRRRACRSGTPGCTRRSPTGRSLIELEGVQYVVVAAGDACTHSRCAAGDHDPRRRRSRGTQFDDYESSCVAVCLGRRCARAGARRRPRLHRHADAAGPAVSRARSGAAASRVVMPWRANGDAPSDAIVLFGGPNLSAWTATKQAWKVENGYVEVVPNAVISTKEKFSDVQLHVEWAAPRRSEARARTAATAASSCRAATRCRCSTRSRTRPTPTARPARSTASGRRW